MRSSISLRVALTGYAGQKEIRLFVDGVQLRADGKQLFGAQQRVVQVGRRDAKFSALPFCQSCLALLQIMM